MTEFDPHAAPPEKRGFSWLAGRVGRKEYWAYVGFVFALGIGLSFVPGLGSTNMGLTIALGFVQARRLHDFNRSGWWAVAATLGPGLVMLPLIAVSLEMAALVGLLAEVVLIIWIGIVKGSPDENRFGPPRAFS